ncbi:hypothetical protein XENORESO_008004 [Xenotaenia resolanae]|uniref:Neuroblast differentiation-associated protein AHNAK-like n=1 Tax=Xenotaenia resolanae TaxID=208358 RepID=A0ABV0WJ74_9TELE
MSGVSKSASVFGNLALDDSRKGLSITGNADDTTAAKSGLKVEDDIVAATINLGNLDKNDVQNILETLKPYGNNMKVLTKKDLSAGVDLDSFGLGLKDHTEGRLKKGLSLDASADPPALSFSGLSGQLNLPTRTGDLPNLCLNKPTGNAGATVTMPSIGLPASDIKANSDGSIKAPDVSASDPQVKMANASLTVDKPDLKTSNVQAPQFTMPDLNLPHIEVPKTKMDTSRDMDLPSVSGKINTPNLNLPASQTPDLHLTGPKLDLNDPDIKLETPNASIEASSGKVKWPHFKLKSPKDKMPDADLNADISVPNVKVPKTKFGSDLSGPDVDINLPKADIKDPEVDVKTPDLDLDFPSGKINWPHRKWKKPKFHGSKGSLDIDVNVDTPDADLSVPKVSGEVDAPNDDLNLPKADLNGPDLDVDVPSGKINWPHLKWKKPKLQLPKKDLGIDGDPNTPDLNLTAPKIEGDFNVPKTEVNLPKADLTAPEVHIQAPDLDVDAPSGKINWPHQKWKKPKLHGPKAEVDGSLNAPEVNLSAPKIDGKINSPDIDLNLPKADVGKPDIDFESPSGKIKTTTFKKPKWSISQPKIKELDVNFRPPKLDTNLDLAKVNVDTPKVDLKEPEIETGLDVQDFDINLSKADLKGLDADAQMPELDSMGGKLKRPKMKWPKFDISGAKVTEPNFDFDAKSPNLDLSLPDVDTKVPKADLTAPNVNLEGPHLSLPAPKIECGLSVPKIDGKKVEPDFDLSSPKTNLAFPDINIATEDLKGSGVEIDLPTRDSKDGNPDLRNAELNLSGPKMKGTLSGPNIDTKLQKTELEAPNVTMKLPNLDINPPKANLETPDGQLKTPDLDVDAHLGDFKMPHFKVPALDLSSPKAEIPNINAPGKAGIKAPEVKVGSLPADSSFSVPAVELNATKAEGPKVDIKAPDLDTNVENLKFPHIKLPKFSFSGSKLKSGKVNASTNAEDHDDVDSNHYETDVPLFKFHTLPKRTIDGIGEIGDVIGSSKRDHGENDFVISKGVRLPISNTSSKITGKIDIMERLKLAKEKTANASEMNEKTDELKPATPGDGASAETGESSLERGGTFKIEQPESATSSADENQKLSLGLSNMLGLSIADPNAV